jgi:hypothetical protein
MKDIETEDITLDAIEKEYNSFYSACIFRNVHNSDNQ